MAFKILGVDHIGIAVNDLKEVGSFWESIGLKSTGEETVEEQKVTTGFYPTANGAEIELLGATADDSPIAKFIEKNAAVVSSISLSEWTILKRHLPISRKRASNSLTRNLARVRAVQ